MDEPKKKYDKPFSHPRWNDMGTGHVVGKVKQTDEEMRESTETLIRLIEEFTPGTLTEEQKDEIRKETEEEIRREHEKE